MVYYKPSTEQTAASATAPQSEEMSANVVNAQPVQAATMKMEQQEASRLRGGCGCDIGCCGLDEGCWCC
ncbi:hypothetical protein FRB94_006487 [Tulasnella sp. JGI-2019a]|nr:hypothetical protein FRB94_006487 [Tulasnella sp. JGI-2019a]KAG8999135.1 hypothetical protein FRB93_013292 [Tulasnella sp. JGI-2019a]KAG9028483.1 hypothetical protein FRB95_006425 [Tulasnella sp. JGI-2019a]